LALRWRAKSASHLSSALAQALLASLAAGLVPGENLFHSFSPRGNGTGFLKRCGVSGRKPIRVCFPRRPGTLGLWGKAKSGVHAAGFD